MVDRIISKLQKQRLELWGALKGVYKIKGYEYYQPPPAVKYRYPAPGSCDLNEVEKPNMYKTNWKQTFRNSEHNIRPQELRYFDDDPRQAENYVS